MELIERYPPDIKAHAKRIGELAKEYGSDYEIAALLHDILEDTETTEDELPAEYREDILTLTRKKNRNIF